MGTTCTSNTTFWKCYHDFTPKNRALLNDLLGELAKDHEQNECFKLWNEKEIPSSKIGDTIVRNLREEHFLAVPYMKILLNKMIKVYQDFKANPEEADNSTFLRTFILNIQNELLYDQKKTLQFKGEIIKDIPQYIGTAIPKDKLTRYLIENYGVFENNELKAEMVLNNFENYKDDSKYKNLLIKEANRLIWFTWSPNNHENPLETLTGNYADDVCNALALNMHGLTNNDLYFIIFKQSDALAIHKPTFCDAGFGHYFRPPLPDFKAHGLTKPLLNGVDRLPEGVGRSQSWTFSHIHEIKLYSSKGLDD